MLQQPSPHGLQQQQHPSDDLYANPADLIHNHHLPHHHHHLHQQQQQQQQQQIQLQQQHPHQSNSSAAVLPMDLHLPQGYPFYSTSHSGNNSANNNNSSSRKGGLEDFVTGHHHPNSGLHSGILEMRKEKSRDAARSRRGKENYEFYELAKMLPLPPAITSQLDKASIIRLTISFLRLKDFSSNGDPAWIKESLSSISSANSNSSSNVTSSTGSSSASGSSSSSSNKANKGNSRSRSHQHNQHQQQQQQHPHHQMQLQQHQQHNSIPANIHVELFDQHQGTHILQSLDGFAFSLGSDGRFLYISETVSIYLGLSQVEMTGSSVFDYVHTADHAELAQQLGLTLATNQTHQSASSSATSSSQQLPPSPASGTGSVDDGNSCMNPDVTSLMSLESNSAYQGLDRSFCIRMKSTLTKRGCHFKSSGYRVVMVLCRLRPQSQAYTAGKSGVGQPSSGPQGQNQPVPLLGMIAMAIALPPPTVHEVRLEPDMFVTRLAFDLRIIHCEPRIAELLEFVAEDLTGRSLYTLCHVEDVRLLRKAHTDLMHKGQVMTPYYRILNRHGGFTWIQSCATVVCNSKNGDEQSIVCVNYVLSRTEMKNLVVDQCQLESAPIIQIKPTIFKTDHGASDVLHSSPDGSSSESSESLPKSGTTLIDPHRSSVPSSEQSRPSSEVEVEVVTAPPEESVSSGMRTSRGPSGRHHHHRSAKRKYEDLVSVPSATDSSMIGLDNNNQHHSTDNSNSNESASIQDQQNPNTLTDHQSEVDVARWKRLYAGAMENESLQDRDLDGNGLNGNTTDFSTDALLSNGKPRSTIQWIGAPPVPSGSTSSAATAAALSVPSLLRQLYASRESVIRANVHAAAAAAAGRTPSGYFSNGETLPTPPTGVNGGNDYPGDVFPPTSSHSYHSAATGSFLPEYLPAMTPPSSVSPRDAAAGALFAAEASLRHSAYSGLGSAESSYSANPTQPLALKPHHHVHYGHGSIEHHHHAHHHHNSGGSHHQYASVQPLVSADAGQFYSHTPSGFHLYHPQVSKSSSASSVNNSATWYPN
ncbi:protein trachealess-like isoform X3 [Daphnia pulex]|uniref:protein trachealess-like isoform X3 n=1 Tax=Daphnia pulex TaxID=6669 RepID=UPI001EE01D1B|nr:protein trachealess-like isoform X3 [Daphnia pulex]